VDWAPLRSELALWQADGRTLPVWWRDDDAIEPTPQLDRMATMSKDLGIPVHLAVIPGRAKRDLVSYVHSHGVFRPVVHGWRHVNHGPRRGPASEFFSGNILSVSRAWRGMRRMRKLFGDSFLPMFVAPWNHVSPSLHEPLASLGFKAVSVIGPRPRRMACDGLVHINAHIDPIDWSRQRRLVDPDEIVTWLTAHLQDRRLGRCDATEPLGLMTHHLVHEEEVWDFCAALLTELLSGPCRPVDLAEPGHLSPADDHGRSAKADSRGGLPAGG
jgi:hypothetical protein